MVKKTRLWLPAALAVIAVAATTTSVRADASKYFADDMEVVFSINLRHVLDSKLLKDNRELETWVRTYFEGQIRQNDEAVKIQKALGFDPFRDLNSVTFAGQGGQDQKNSLVVVTGKFDTGKFAAAGAQAARQHRDFVKTHRSGGKTVYEFTPPGDNRFFMSVVDAKTILISQSIEGIKAAITRGSGGRGATNRALKALLDKTNTKQSLYFAATKGAIEQGIKDSNNPQVQAANAFTKDVNGVTGSVNVDKNIAFKLGVITKNAQTAKEFNEKAAQGLLFANLMIQQQAQQNPAMAPLVDIVRTLQTSANGSSMNLTGNVPSSMIKQGVELLKQFTP